MIQEDEFTDNSGHKFYSRSWIPKEEPVATVYFCHGLGEHTGRYDTLFEKFNEANIRVHSFDSRGYGRTVKLNGQEGDIGGYSMVEKDITAFIDRFPSDTPKILMGHSLGGLWVLKYALDQSKKFSAVIASAPALKHQTPIGFFKYWGGRLLKPVFPKLLFPTGLHIDNISRIPKVVSDYKVDPLAIHKISLQTAFDALTIGEGLRGMDNPTLECSILMSHGDADDITSYEASREFFEKLTVVGIKEGVWIESGYHELHNDLCQEEVISRYTEFIKGVLKL